MKQFLPSLAYALLFSGLIACSSPQQEPEISMNTIDVDNIVARGDGDIVVNNGQTGAKENMPDVEAGVLTAGEWNDLNNWSFWESLMQKENFFAHQGMWHLYPHQRYTLQLLDEQERAAQDVTVRLLGQNKEVLWTAKTNVKGIAELWAAPFEKNRVAVAEMEIVTAKKKYKIQAPQVYTKGINTFQLKHSLSAPEPTSEIMFVVDATGSMEDEIQYLKKELDDVMKRVSTAQPGITFKTGSVFYRDQDDEYVTRKSGLSANLDATLEFIYAQGADGGGDYPEAIALALEEAIQEENWSSSAESRMLFLLLDAPAHDDKESLNRLHQAIQQAAEKGIQIIPVASSGVDKETEFLMRFLSVLTNGTYVFMTDHSGVGNGHIEPTIGDYEVEYLNDLLVRLIKNSIKQAELTQ